MTKYTQLTQEQRYQIEALLKANHSQKSISLIIGVHKSTICRELQRNVGKRGRHANQYITALAERKTIQRHKEKNKCKKFTEALKKEASKYLTEDRLSPELISYYFTCKQTPISHESIYQWIWNSKKSFKSEDLRYKNLYKYLKHGKRRRKRGSYKDNRGCIPNRTSIEERPKIVSKRSRLGDLEIDLMIGKNHKGALLVVLDRSSLKTKMVKLKNKESSQVTQEIIKLLEPEKEWIKTITFDNDMAFAGHEKIAKELNIKSYFTRPYTSQDKGSVENRIGVIRRFFPKKTDLLKISQQKIMEVENKINNRPVRKFDYKTPNDIFNKKIISKGYRSSITYY